MRVERYGPDMTIKLKPVSQQVIVITGATSGIGLVTARMAGERGAKLVLIARNLHALNKLHTEFRSKGIDAKCLVADVANQDEVGRAADDAIKQFGRIDTWVNNAGVSIYGWLGEVPEEDSRRLFDTNFWGTVNGSLTAAKRMEEHGGVIINIGSTLSDRAIPIQGMYSASKHAVKGFTDALRMELESQKLPICLTLIKPSAIDTPYTEHAKNFMGVKPENPAPVYAPQTVAETILYCAENPVRDVFVGGGGKALSVLGNVVPGVTDKYMESAMIDGQMTDRPAEPALQDSLYISHDDELKERGGYEGHVAKSSVYTSATLHPVRSAGVVALGLGAAYVIGKKISTGGRRDN